MADNATYALAKAMATMDGKLDAFLQEELQGTRAVVDPDYTGHYLGYMSEANELLEDLEVAGWLLVRKDQL